MSENEMREPGFYWVVAPQEPDPIVARWDGSEWWLPGWELGAQAREVRVLSERLAPAADANRPVNPVFIRERCPRCHGDGQIMVAAHEDTIARARLIDPGAWSLNGSAARRAAVCEMVERQIRSALE